MTDNGTYPRERNRLYFDATNSTDTRRCAYCKRLVKLDKCLVHAAMDHGIDSDLVVIQPGLRV